MTDWQQIISEFKRALPKILEGRDPILNGKLREMHEGTNTRTREEVTAEEVVRLYVGEELSTNAIARRLGCSATAVQKRLREAGVVLRSPEEGRRLLLAQRQARRARHA